MSQYDEPRYDDEFQHFAAVHESEWGYSTTPAQAEYDFAFALLAERVLAPRGFYASHEPGSPVRSVHDVLRNDDLPAFSAWRWIRVSQHDARQVGVVSISVMAPTEHDDYLDLHDSTFELEIKVSVHDRPAIVAALTLADEVCRKARNRGVLVA